MLLSRALKTNWDKSSDLSSYSLSKCGWSAARGPGAVLARGRVPLCYGAITRWATKPLAHFLIVQ